MTQRSQVTALRLIMGPTQAWFTLADLRRWLLVQEILASEAGISARLRDLRREGHTVEKRVKAGANKLFEYRLILCNQARKSA